ncbi:MAG TPA: hypothetical protein VK464_23935 [Symbiobacteriaceae bacterium]|nr:hypothetical protein [Symbiobacteriaceae bacterium]
MSHELITNFPPDPILDLDPWVGQRSASYRFARIDGVTGAPLGDLTPLPGATLSHDTSRTIMRQLNLQLGVRDTATVVPLTDRIDVFMVFPAGVEYPLGRYLFTNPSRQKFTSGSLGSYALTDEMYVVDQELEVGYSAVGKNTAAAIAEIMATFPFTVELAATPYTSTEAWGIGISRGQVLQSLALSGDYFNPWFGNDTHMHWIRAFDPFDQIPDFNLDQGNRVMRQPIIEDDDILTAPNRFIVVSNNPTDPSVPVVGSADVPPSAPHSIQSRGFVVPKTVDLQVANSTQATAVAQNLVQRQTIFERVQLATPPDPRHDSYNVIRWQGALWLEIGWTLELSAGGLHTHLLRKTYSSHD